ncbi:MAG: hypothetical protein HYU37_21185 [Acidobacteria bacterium]|nr:hypothetical protein [Acidobacteriota bacterium]
MAAELQPRTSQAYDAYLETATARFLSRVDSGGPPPAGRDGVLPARPGSEDGIIGVPGGLVHHWAGAAFLRGARLEEVLAVSCAYDAYSRMYRSVIASRLLARDGGNAYQVHMRLRETEAGISTVLDVRSTVRYVRVANARVYAVSHATEIREVRNAGRRDEQLLPPGRDSGYLWRANTFSYFEQRADGVDVEMETLGLSRRFPLMLGWMIEPIARRVGRRSVARSLTEFAAAVQAGRITTDTCLNLAAKSAAHAIS